jgi:hypothetical protein
MAKKAAKKARTPKQTARKPKQERFAEMADAKIPDLDAAARAYAEGRDERMAQTKVEKELKTKLIDKMHQHKRTTYRFDDVSIELVPEGEKVKVRIKGDDAEELQEES